VSTSSQNKGFNGEIGNGRKEGWMEGRKKMHAGHVFLIDEKYFREMNKNFCGLPKNLYLYGKVARHKNIYSGSIITDLDKIESGEGPETTFRRHAFAGKFFGTKHHYN
jgi:hypothetical protein